MLNIKKRKMTVDEIEGKSKGKLTTQLVYRDVVKNDYKLWFISHTQAPSFFYLTNSDNTSAATVAFTEVEYAMNYINKLGKKEVLLSVFGNDILLMRRSLFKVQFVMDETNESVLSTIAVNPNDITGFTPLYLDFFRKLLSENRLTLDIAEDIHNNAENKMVTYNREKRAFELSSKDVLDGGFGNLEIDF